MSDVAQFEITATITLRVNEKELDWWLPDVIQENLEEGEEILSYTNTLIRNIPVESKGESN